MAFFRNFRVSSSLRAAEGKSATAAQLRLQRSLSSPGRQEIRARFQIVGHAVGHAARLKLLEVLFNGRRLSGGAPESSECCLTRLSRLSRLSPIWPRHPMRFCVAFLAYSRFLSSIRVAFLGSCSLQHPVLREAHHFAQPQCANELAEHMRAGCRVWPNDQCAAVAQVEPDLGNLGRLRLCSLY